ncbi:MAG: type II toxin-antitoxin system RelE/ParE family toxin [Gammaproteobacteria bacterium]|nr:type II toxin-antitoxin system RelE/ParE family toxin [Gammaproteobacteria bacterium]
MPAYKVTNKAKADLIAIGRYTTKKWGVAQRNDYLKQLDNCFSQISENPKLGVTSDLIKKDYRKFPQGSHLIFYKQNLNGIIEIIRVLHKTMDIESNIDKTVTVGT